MEKRFFTNWRIGLILVFAASVILYLPSLMGGSIWDDDDLISGAAFGENSLYSALTHAFLGHYFRPLTSISLVLDSYFAKQTPFYYHQTNILLHSLTAVFVAILAFQVTKKPLAGILGGLFFATQPLQVGASAWIGGRTDSLSAFFLSVFLVSLVHYYDNPSNKRLWLTAVIFLLTALSKEQAAAILLAVPLSEFAFGNRDPKALKKFALPYGTMIVIYIVMWLINAPAPYGAPNGLISTVLLACKTASHYGRAFLVPNRDSILTFTLENYQGAHWYALGAALVIGFGFLVYVGWKRCRPLAFVALCGLLVYMPVSNFPIVPSFVVGPYRFAEAGVFFACVLGVLGAYAFNKRQWVLGALLLANLAAGTSVSWWGVRQWTTPFNLFRSLALLDNHFIVGIGNYSHALDLNANSKEALGWTDRTLTWILGTDKWLETLETKKLKAITPEVKQTLKTNSGIPDIKALGWFISCNAASLNNLKQTDRAIRVEKMAYMVAPKDVRICFALGQILLPTDRKESIRLFEKALDLTPKYSACAAALAHERLVDHRYQDAVDLLNRALKDQGWNSNAWLDMADAKIGLRDFAGAEVALKESEKAMLAAKKEEVAKRRKKITELKR